MKNHFKCGHIGKGKYCHRCDQAATADAQAKKEIDASKITALKQKAERLYASPKKSSGAVLMPSEPVPT